MVEGGWGWGGVRRQMGCEVKTGKIACMLIYVMHVYKHKKINLVSKLYYRVYEFALIHDKIERRDATPPPPGSASETRILAVEFRNTETIYHINLLNCQTFFSCCTCSSESIKLLR